MSVGRPGPKPLFVFMVMLHGAVPDRPAIRNTFDVVPPAALNRAPVLKVSGPSLMIARWPCTVYWPLVNVVPEAPVEQPAPGVLIRTSRFPLVQMFLM